MTSDPRVDKEGKRTFERLQPGKYRIYVGVRTGSSGGSVQIEQREVAVGAGPSRESFVLPPLYELTVVLGEDFKGYLQFYAQGMESGGYLGQPSHGRLAIRNLPAGQYNLVAQTEEGEVGMTVTVPSRSEVSFEAKRVTAVRVRIRDEGGALAQGGFRDGDLVVGVEGAAFEGSRDMRGKLLSASQKDPAHVTVLRGDRQIEIEVPGELLGGRGRDLGGSMEPAVR